MNKSNQGEAQRVFYSRYKSNPHKDTREPVNQITQTKLTSTIERKIEDIFNSILYKKRKLI
jgi:hypothetical protein